MNKLKRHYLAVLHGDSQMGASSTFKILKGSEIKKIHLYGDYVQLYELASPERLTKEQAIELGLVYHG